MALEPVSDQQGPDVFGTLLLEAVQKPVGASMGATMLAAVVRPWGQPFSARKNRA
jgi:hypothetical protein